MRLKNVKSIQIRKEEDKGLETGKESAELCKVLTKMHEQLRSIITSPSFVKEAFTSDCLKNELSQLLNMAETLKCISSTPEKAKEEIGNISEFMKHVLQKLDNYVMKENLEFKKDLKYIALLNSAVRQMLKIIHHILRETNPECYIALSCLDELFAAHMELFVAKVDDLSNYIEQLKEKTYEAARDSKSDLSYENIFHENINSRRVNDNQEHSVNQIFNQKHERQDNVFKTNSRQKIPQFPSSKNQLNSTLRSQKSVDRLTSTKSLSPISNRNVTSDKIMSLKELKEWIVDIEAAKRRYDALCDKKQLRYESLKTYMPIYLKRKFDNPKDLKQFKEKFQRSIDNYCGQEISVQIFKTIYENVIDEEFFTISADIRDKIHGHLEVS